MKIAHVDSKISEVKMMIERLNSCVFDLILASGELEARYKVVSCSKNVTQTVRADLLEIEKKVDNMMQPYKSIVQPGS